MSAVDSTAFVSLGFVLASIVLLGAAVYALRRPAVFGLTAGLAVALLLASLAALSGSFGLATHGYRAFTHEELAAVIRTRPTGPKRFAVEMELVDGTVERFEIAGDQLYVDARILKWKAFGNLLGLHTVYELDRIGGRYLDLDDEKNRPRTIASLAPERVVDLFGLRRRYDFLEPLVDAEYGSATFAMARTAADFELRVSTTGLLLRRIERG